MAQQLSTRWAQAMQLLFERSYLPIPTASSRLLHLIDLNNKILPHSTHTFHYIGDSRKNILSINLQQKSKYIFTQVWISFVMKLKECVIFIIQWVFSVDAKLCREGYKLGQMLKGVSLGRLFWLHSVKSVKDFGQYQYKQ